MYPLIRANPSAFNKEFHRRECSFYSMSIPLRAALTDKYNPVWGEKLENLYFDTHWAIAENIEDDICDL